MTTETQPLPTDATLQQRCAEKQMNKAEAALRAAFERPNAEITGLSG